MTFKIWLETEEGSIIAYHGSPTKITSFTTDFLGEGHDQEGPGIYFTTSRDDAANYGPHIHKVILRPRKLVKHGGRINRKQIETLILASANVQNIAELAKIDMDKYWDIPLSNFDENPVKAFQEAVNNVVEYSTSPHDAFQNVWIVHFRYKPQKYLEEMVKLGYDGVKVEKNDLNHYIIFNPSIIEMQE
jgi:hypothetical protein